MPRLLRVISIVVMAVLALAGCSLFDDDGDGADSDVVIDGPTIYTQNCASCHGGRGQGGIGPEIGGGTVAEKFTVEEHTAVVADGQGGMPSFDSQLSEAQIEAVVAFERDELGR
jgi:mono/diheme cytochrome c family protein